MATYYWVGGSGVWNASSTTNWAASSGGAGGAGVPNVSDTAIFDTNSGTAAVVDVTATATALNVTVNKSDINLSFSGSCVFAGLFTLTLGTLTLNSYNLTTARFSSNNTNSRTIDFGAGKIVLTGNSVRVLDMGNVTGFVSSGSKQIEANYAGAAGTRQIFFGVNAGGTETNALSILVSAGSDIVDVLSVINNLSFAGFSGSLAVGSRTIYGDVTLSSTMTITAGASVTYFQKTTGEQTIFSAGIPIDLPITFRGGAIYKLLDAFTVLKVITLTTGHLNANNQNVSSATFALEAGTKTLSLGSGTWTVTGATWNANTNVTGLTVSASTGTINMTSASAKTFSGGGKTWPTLNQGGAGDLTIAQSNTFANITNTVQPATITLTSGTTQAVTNFNVSGTAGNLITLNASSAGSRATITDGDGNINSVSYVSIKDIAATGYAEWRAYTSNGNVDGGNNVGWIFDAPPFFVASEYPPELRSFTEKRRF